MATKKQKQWYTDGFEPSAATKTYKNKAETAYDKFADTVNKGIQTSAATTSAWNSLQNLQKNNKLTDTFRYGNQKGYNKALSDIANRKAFSYDLSKDQLYQTAKENYMNMGQQAMADTIGQASAMTGGYGNSYATTAGSQAYQGYLQQLNSNISDYYNMALNTYANETDRLNSVYSAYANDYAQKQSDWAQNWNVYNQRFANISDLYNNSRNYDLNAYNADVSAKSSLSQQASDMFNTSYNADIDLWDKANQNLLTIQSMRDAWAQNQAENAYKDKALDADIDKAKADTDYQNRALDETIRSNRASEDYNDKVLGLKTGSGNSSSGSQNLKQAISVAKNLTNPTALYEYAENLSQQGYSTEEMAIILASAGKSPQFMEDYENGKYSVNQKVLTPKQAKEKLKYTQDRKYREEKNSK